MTDRDKPAGSAARPAGIACLEMLTPEVHRLGIDAIGAKYDLPLHATGFGHIIAIRWAPEPVVDYRTRMQDDSERITNVAVALMNEHFYHFSFGSFLLSTTHTEADIDSLLGGIERALHNLGFVS